MKPIVIATWPFAKDAVLAGGKVLASAGKAEDAVIAAITQVEDDPNVDSVGYGGLPNIHGEMQLDAAMMMGDTLRMGAVMGLEGIKNPIKVARDLAMETYNNVLCGQGAQDYALEKGHAQADMLHEAARIRWEAAVAAGQKKPVGHDTIGCLALDAAGKLVAGVSTSGLGYKHRGRVGDSPLAGCGFYADSEIGGAVATGVGEDIMKGCICYAVTDAMRSGLHPQAALEQVLDAFVQRMKRGGDDCRQFAVIAINKDGQYGGACHCDFEYSLWQDGGVITVKPQER